MDAACGTGTYANALSGATDCTPCPIGTYGASTTQSSVDACSACPTDTTTLTSGASALTSCLCVAGKIGTITTPASQCDRTSLACQKRARGWASSVAVPRCRHVEKDTWRWP